MIFLQSQDQFGSILILFRLYKLWLEKWKKWFVAYNLKLRIYVRWLPYFEFSVCFLCYPISFSVVHIYTLTFIEILNVVVYVGTVYLRIDWKHNQRKILKPYLYEEYIHSIFIYLPLGYLLSLKFHDSIQKCEMG